MTELIIVALILAAVFAVYMLGQIAESYHGHDPMKYGACYYGGCRHENN